ncbi:DUF3429 domain-containing protein [Vibrio sonorensis]|uniref:DUF3429 domain-containing protein n=1 Tax=Vibrio sonorensis TaxID=1004316 RepID=UPI0008D905FE|nr:DUF3429 domain-containing protein [Vibrio sonorensis]
MSATAKDTMVHLGYLGLIPFVFCLILIVFDVRLFELSGHKMFTAYSAVILSFLSGVLWGNAIDHFSHKLSRNALILSNLFALIAWGVLLTKEGSYFSAIVMLSFGYLAVWFAEKTIRQSEHEEKPAGYSEMRGKLTLGVMIMHGLVLIA